MYLIFNRINGFVGVQNGKEEQPVWTLTANGRKSRSLFCMCNSGVACCQSQHQCHIWRMRTSMFEVNCTSQWAWLMSKSKKRLQNSKDSFKAWIFYIEWPKWPKIAPPPTPLSMFCPPWMVNVVNLACHKGGNCWEDTRSKRYAITPLYLSSFIPRVNVLEYPVGYQIWNSQNAGKTLTRLLLKKCGSRGRGGTGGLDPPLEHHKLYGFL